MTERIGRERLLARLLSGTPDRTLDAICSVAPEDAADLRDLRDDLGRPRLLDAARRPPRSPAGAPARGATTVRSAHGGRFSWCWT